MSYDDEKSLSEGDEKDGIGFSFDLDEEGDLFDDDSEDEEIPDGFHEDLGPGQEEGI